MTSAETTTSATVTTRTKPRVSRAWKVCGMKARTRRRYQGRRGLPRPVAPGRDVVARSALGEGVSGSSDGQDERRARRVVLDLVAQVAHVDVDRLLVLVERLVVAEQLEQLATRI